MPSWPRDSTQLVGAQRALATETPDPWLPPDHELLVGGCFACLPAGISGRGEAGDPIWAAAVVMRGRGLAGHNVTTGRAGAPYEAGLLALRIGPVLERVVGGLPDRPDVLLVDATGKDHPRRAGLALHLGAVLDLPTVGVTHRPLLAHGQPPRDRRGATSPLVHDGEVVGFWLRTKPGVRPLAVHAAWRIDAPTAVAVVSKYSGRWRTPEPLRRARHLARTARDRVQ
ncbi:MAG: endonuclease V [Jiangellaceae bacterium]|nr:endonuclease V [Jiangellaceae bacterium]